MRLIIVGVGKVGATLVEKLSKEDHDLVVVDKDSEEIETLVNKFDVRGVCGSGCEREVLLKAEADKADFFIACTNRDELNILCCMLAKNLGTKHTIARVREPEYFTEIDYMSKELGIDFMFNPEYRTAQEIAQVLKFPFAVSIESFAGGRVMMMELKIASDNPIVGKKVMDIAKDFNAKVLFPMVERDDEVFIPKGDFVIMAGDKLRITAEDKDLALFCKKLHVYKQRSRSVFIVGGGKVGYYLAKELLASGVGVKIIDRSEDRCDELKDSLRKATVLCGDGTDPEVLDEEGFKSSDACVALTAQDESNVIIGLYASSLGIKKVIAKVDSSTVADMVSDFGLDSVIAPRNVIANHILRFVRAFQSGSGRGISTLYKLHEEVEALEFNVSEDFPGLNVPIKELKLKDNCLFCGIVRDKEFIIPTGDVCFRCGDKVLVVTTDMTVNDLNQLLK